MHTQHNTLHNIGFQVTPRSSISWFRGPRNLVSAWCLAWSLRAGRLPHVPRFMNIKSTSRVCCPKEEVEGYTYAHTHTRKLHTSKLRRTGNYMCACEVFGVPWFRLVAFGRSSFRLGRRVNQPWGGWGSDCFSRALLMAARSHAVLIVTEERMSMVLTSSEDEIVKIWNPSSGECLLTLATY